MMEIKTAQMEMMKRIVVSFYQNVIAPCILGNFACFFIVCGVFQIQYFKIIFQEYHQSLKQFWIQIRSDVLSDRIWVQAVCKIISADDTCG